MNVSSVFGLVGTPLNSDYCATKFAVRGYTQSLAIEFDASPINIHCLHPGGIRTNIVRKEEGREFSNKYLITPPEDIVKHVIKCIRSGKTKIVYGQDSLRMWIASNLVPHQFLNRTVYREFKNVMDITKYFGYLKK